jgi:hypothetical protein
MEEAEALCSRIGIMIQVLMIDVMDMANGCQFMRYGTGKAAVLRLKSTPEVQVWQGLRLAAQGERQRADRRI